MSDYQEQQARNETTSRDMNEWANDGDAPVVVADDRLGAYLCECSDASCRDPIQLTRPEYESIRGVSVRFAIALNHENPEIDRVLSENARFATVEKFYGVGARIARATDPRR